MQYFSYIIFRIFVAIFALLPFPILYLKADFVAFLLYRVFKYRRKVIAQNIRNSFPEKNEAAIELIIKNTYSNLADLIVEAIKGFSLSEKTLRERYRFTNPELILNDKSLNGNTLGMAAHLTNWEWGTMAYPLFLPSVTNVGLYQPIKNKRIDAYVQRKRSKTNLLLVSVKRTNEYMMKLKDESNHHYVFISDQTPGDPKKSHWLPFLNQDTPFLHGGDEYSRTLGYPVYFILIRRVKRGFYEVSFELLEKDPKNTPPQYITQIYAERLEKAIRDSPSDWLWSHRRWKHKRTNELN